MTAQPLPPGVVRRQVDVTIGGQHVATLDVQADSVASFTDRTDATDAEFEARLERLDRLEVADVAADLVGDVLHKWMGGDRDYYDAPARAAIAALKPPPPDGGDVR